MSQRHGLVGKPDYLVEVSGAGKRLVVPLEVKSRKRPPIPDPGHLLQLATYCLLVEDIYGQRPPHGYLRYADMTVKIDFARRLPRCRAHECRRHPQGAQRQNVTRSHQDARRCQRCGYLDSCGAEALAAPQ